MEKNKTLFLHTYNLVGAGDEKKVIAVRRGRQDLGVNYLFVIIDGIVKLHRVLVRLDHRRQVESEEPPTIPYLSTRGNTTVWLPVFHEPRQRHHSYEAVKVNMPSLGGEKTNTLRTLLCARKKTPKKTKSQ